MRMILFAFVLMPLAVSAQSSFRDVYRIPVVPVSQTEFEVIEASGAGGTQLWCAAGQYARTRLSADSGRLYVARARGPSERVPGRRSVVFSTVEVEGSFTSVDQGVRVAGKTFRIGHAEAICRSRYRIDLRILGG